MASDGGSLKRNFERDGVVVAEVAYSYDEKMDLSSHSVMLQLVKPYFDSIDLICDGSYELLY